MIEFIIGSIYTLATVSFGFYLGYLFATQKPESVVNRLNKSIKVVNKKIRKPLDSGGVKPKTYRERQLGEKDTKGFVNRVKELKK